VANLKEDAYIVGARIEGKGYQFEGRHLYSLCKMMWSCCRPQLEGVLKVYNNLVAT